MRRVFAAIRDAGRVDPADAAGLTPTERETLVSFAQGLSIRPDSGGEGDQAGDGP